MRVAFALAVVALGRVAHADPDCAQVLARLDRQLAEAIAKPIKLASPPVDADGQPCAAADATGSEGNPDAGSSADAPTIETGTISGDRVTVRSDGPHGSGRWWGIDVGVVIGGHRVGACLETSTSWWRNLPDAARRSLGGWHVLDSGALSLWSTLAIGESEGESLALPLVYRVSKFQLVLDQKLTASAIARFGRMYRDATVVDDDDARGMHASAAAAYAAFAAHGACKR